MLGIRGPGWASAPSERSGAGEGQGWGRADASCPMLLPVLLQDTVVVGNELHGLKVKHLHVGGVLGSGEVENGLRGCIQVSPLL